MATSNLSQSSALSTAGLLFGTICVGFGINATIRPENALSFFEFNPPASVKDKQVVDSLMVVYGARDIFMGLATYAAAYSGDRKTLGLILIAVGGVAFVDGAVCWSHGKGEWNHWGYAPVVTAVETLLLGVLDGKKAKTL